MSTSTSSVRVQGTPESALGGAGSADVQEIEDQISMIDRSYEMAQKLRLTPGAETDEARTKALNWLARTKWRKCGDSLRIEETPEMKIARPQKRNAAHAALQSGIHERNTGTSAKGACKEKTIELIKATSPLPSATGFHLLVRLQTAVSEDRLVTDDVINAQDCAAIDDEVNVHEFTEGTVEEIVEELL
ncbi:hypothetical protein TPS_06244 [Trichinella pseudospiralis]